MGLRSGMTASLAEKMQLDHTQGLRSEYTSHMVSQDIDIELADRVAPSAGSRLDMRLVHAEASLDIDCPGPLEVGCSSPFHHFHSPEADRMEDLGTLNAVQSHHYRCVFWISSFHSKS